ncbi:MAG: hypothetical protein RR914_00205 [Oscillospiraceae bacterium]
MKNREGAILIAIALIIVAIVLALAAVKGRVTPIERNEDFEDVIRVEVVSYAKYL